MQQPWWLPYPLYRWLAERKAARFLAEPLARDYPDMQERLGGLAEESGSVCAGSCSSTRSSRSSRPSAAARLVRGLFGGGHPRQPFGSGAPIIARNFDYLPLVQPFYSVRDSRPADKLRALEFTIAPLAGTVDGINEAGLCLTYNYAFTNDEPSSPQAPLSMAITEALQQCRTVTEAAEFLCQSRAWGAVC